MQSLKEKQKKTAGAAAAAAVYIYLCTNIHKPTHVHVEQFRVNWLLVLRAPIQTEAKEKAHEKQQQQKKQKQRSSDRTLLASASHATIRLS